MIVSSMSDIIFQPKCQCNQRRIDQYFKSQPYVEDTVIESSKPTHFIKLAVQIQEGAHTT